MIISMFKFRNMSTSAHDNVRTYMIILPTNHELNHPNILCPGRLLRNCQCATCCIILKSLQKISGFRKCRSMTDFS